MSLRKKLVPIVSLCLSVGMATIVSVIPTQNGTRAASAATTGISLEFLGRANSGSGLAGSEIAAYDAKTKRLFVTNGAYLPTNSLTKTFLEKPFSSGCANSRNNAGKPLFLNLLITF